MVHQHRGVPGSTPAVRAFLPGQRVEHRVHVRGHRPPVEGVVIPHVHHHSGLDILQVLEPSGQAGAADPAGQERDPSCHGPGSGVTVIVLWLVP